MVKNMFDSLHQDWRSKNVKVSNGQKINVITAPEKPKMHHFGKKETKWKSKLNTCFQYKSTHFPIECCRLDRDYLLHLKFYGSFLNVSKH